MMRLVLIAAVLGLGCATLRTTREIAAECRIEADESAIEGLPNAEYAYRNCINRETMIEIERTKEAEQRRRRWRSIAWGASVMAMSVGGAMAGNARPPDLDGMRHSGGCTSDLGCGVGRACVKPAGQINGYCAQTVDQFGTPVSYSPRSDSIGPGARQCWFATDCPIGFDCQQGSCVKGPY